MALFSKLFGGGRAAEPKGPDETYKGFRIFADPAKEGSRFRVGARIESGEGDGLKSHRLIRADVLESRDLAVDVSVNKAKQLIDEQGDGLFR
ncbi:MAG: HlyU family transcriptional regulator [Pseudomonadota bacterium]